MSDNYPSLDEIRKIKSTIPPITYEHEGRCKARGGRNYWILSGGARFLDKDRAESVLFPEHFAVESLRSRTVSGQVFAENIGTEAMMWFEFTDPASNNLCCCLINQEWIV